MSLILLFGRRCAFGPTSLFSISELSMTEPDFITLFLIILAPFMTTALSISHSPSKLASVSIYIVFGRCIITPALIHFWRMRPSILSWAAARAILSFTPMKFVLLRLLLLTFAPLLIARAIASVR